MRVLVLAGEVLGRLVGLFDLVYWVLRALLGFFGKFALDYGCGSALEGFIWRRLAV